ncbi:MAG TPA: sulfatase-like hydrolase/transferase, partial [Fimbriimonas sp.]|nr:sulfatase-like hydrolase/transferase [Fimbriimonas sp.]
GAKSRAGVKQPFSAPLKQNRPDIIHIVLDGYGRSDSLRKVMRYDNSAFLEALRKRGFQVLPGARANYVQTEQSLSSALNLNYVEHLYPEARPSSMDRTPLDRAIDRSLVSMRLRAIGYTYVAITTGFPFFSFRSADLVLGERSGNALFLTSLLNLTPLPESSWISESQYEVKRKAVLSAFANIAELSAPSRTPKFIFAHILMPHPPFVFGPNGEAAPQRRGGNALSDGSHYMSRGGTPDTYRSGYVGQITYLNKVVIETLDKVLKQAKPDSIIIIHGDHGSKLGLDQDSLSKTDIVEVAPILMAVKGPLMPDNLSPVNLYRIIFSDVFGDPWSELPSHTYYSTWEKPYVYHDVTNRVP